MAIPYYPQYSLLVTATNAGVFPVQVTSLPPFAVGSIFSISGLTSASVTISNATIEQITNAVHNDLSIAVAGKDTSGKVRPLRTDTLGNLVVSTLVPYPYDYIFLSYTNLGLSLVSFKMGGSGGTTVATLNLGYSSTSLTSVTRS